MELVLRDGELGCGQCGNRRFARTIMLPGWQSIEAKGSALRVVNIEPDDEGDAEIGDHLYCTACGQVAELPVGIEIQE